MKTRNRISVIILCLIMVITPIVSMTSCAIDTDCTHYSGTWVETKKPTCTENGVHERICDDCGASEKAIIPMQGHNWTEATCTAPKTCKVCSATEGEALGHIYIVKTANSETLKSVASCSSPAIYYRSCSCGLISTSDEDTFTSGSALEHIDKNSDHICDVCTPILGDHIDADKNHFCDYGCLVPFGECEDTNHDHKCDYGCTKNFGEHIDTNKDHICDYGCNKIVGDHVDTNKDHICDYGCMLRLGVCADNNSDGKCDYGCNMIFAVDCEHEDEDCDGYCDICEEEVDLVYCEHYDDNGDGWCDECDERMSDGNEEAIVNYPWESQTLIFQMTHNTNNNELPSACQRYLAGEDETVSEVIDIDVRNRNTCAEYFTKTVVRYEYYPDTYEYSWGKNISIIEATVKSQTTKDTPDMYCNFVYDLVGASLKGCFANLLTTSRGTGDLKGLNYFEFNREDYDEEKDNRGYMYEYMTSLTLSRHKMYVLASDYFTDMIRAFFIVPVNVNLLEEVGEEITGDRDGNGVFNIDDFYEQVKAGEWTYNLLATYSDEVYTPSSTNATGECTLYDDAVGFAFSNTGLAATGLLYTTSVEIINRKWNDKTNDWEYFYPDDNDDLYRFCDATTDLFQKPGVCIVGSNFDSSWGDSSFSAIRTRFSQNHVLFGDIILVGALEFDEYQTLKESGGGFGVVPVPLYRAGDTYQTQIHSVARAGAIQVNTTKFVECSAFLNYQSTHSTDILNDYYNYKLQYDVADGTRGTVYMLQYIRNHVRSSFDMCWEDAIGAFFTDATVYEWEEIMRNENFQLDLRARYGGIYDKKTPNLNSLVALFAELPE